jgi:general secretion pathway protein B
MSFILDALRKSEHERERKMLPGLVDVPVARPERPRTPVATIAMAAVGVLLAVNLIVLLVVLLRDRDDAPAAAASQPPAATAVSPPAGEPASSVATPAAPAPATAPAASPVPPIPAAGEPDVRPLQEEAAVADEAPPPYADTPPVPRRADATPRVQRATPGVVTAPGPLDAPESAPYAATRGAGAPPARAGANGGTSGVPTIDQLAPQATAGLPPLSLALHVYSGTPAQSWVVLNGRRYQEGAQLQEGPTLERITPDGVVLNHRGLRFLVPRQ